MSRSHENELIWHLKLKGILHRSKNYRSGLEPYLMVTLKFCDHWKWVLKVTGKDINIVAYGLGMTGDSITDWGPGL